MQNLYNDLEKLLKQDERLFAEGKILKNKVSELAIKLDKGLIELLFKDKQGKEHFFIEVAGKFVFDQDKFLKFINNKEFLPDSFTAFKNHIGLIEGDEYLKDSGKMVLAWPYKDCILEGGQDKGDIKHNEIFYNEVLAPDEIDRLFEPKVLTNFKKIDKTGEHKIEQITEQDNLIIKGNNLLALHSLKKKYRGKVKLIYIDPPYNTGNDEFKYNDSFNHSAWLTFMKNRLEIAKELLKDDGVIFVQCDDNEYPYLKVLMDEMHDLKYEMSYYVQVRYAEKTLAENSNYQKLIEQVLCYSKEGFVPNRPKADYTIDKFCWKITELVKGKTVEIGGKKVEIFKAGQFKLEEVKPSINGLKEVWATGTLLRTTAKFFGNHLQERKSIDGLGTLYKVEGIGDDGLGYRYFTGPQRESATKGKYFSGIPIALKKAVLDGSAEKNLVINNFYDMSDAFGNCRQEGGVELRSGKKPEIWLKTLMDIGSKKGELVLDFFSGTGGTCAVAHKTGRRYIGIEQLDYGDNDSVVRLKNVISGDQSGISKAVEWKSGGSFIYMELRRWNEEYMRTIRESKTSKELAAIYKKMQAEAFFRYEIDISKFDEKQFGKLSLSDQKKVLLECLDKNHLYVNYSEIEDATYKIPAEEKKINKAFYGN